MLDFEELYKKYFNRVYKICSVRFANTDLAAEITQEAFARAFEKLDDLRDEDKFLPWVTTIAINYGYSKARLDTLRFNELPPDDLAGYALKPVFPVPQQTERDNFVSDWAGTLGESEQRIFMMKYYYGMTNAAISKEMGVSLSTVKRRLSSLRAKLKDALEKDMLDD